MDTQFDVSLWPWGRLPASRPILEGLALQPQGSPLSELSALKSRVKSRGLCRSLSSWQLCLRIIPGKLICEVYIGHGRECQTKLFMAWMFTRVLPLEHNLQPFILKVWHTRILSSNDRKPGATQSEKNVKLFLVAWQKSFLNAQPRKGACTVSQSLKVFELSAKLQGRANLCVSNNNKVAHCKSCQGLFWRLLS